ncbi:MAG: proline dehydrogenase family protein [Hymenobacteraceae bacterium]|nr:proline dehydrogenase family protein [Hymenobacteraceae bacterium]MDX5397891.1 proline dehydrogenase family protein [Hymenobacteraceae bacterium]MDX5442480.1 proline dehydrogenase family protein [Hymenobacteraceae bacterium]MDX5513962.1 proline dehydrogenase family protein [Hymenobacteraceae bacterium]
MQLDYLKTEKPAMPDFSNLAGAFAHKSNKEVRLAYQMFRLMNNPQLMKLGTTAAAWALKLGVPGVKNLIRNTVYKHFCGGETVTEALEVVEKLDNYHIHTVLDYAAEAEETAIGFDYVKEQILHNISLVKKNSGIGYISVKMTGLGHRSIFEKLARHQPLTDEEDASFIHTHYRLDEICKRASEAGICVYIDAEESWLQEPIDEMAEKMMRLYNQQRVVVFTTLQMYRTDRLEYLRNLIKRNEQRHCILGIKLVRGAYWEKERQHTQWNQKISPVFELKSETDASFNEAVFMCLRHLPKVHLCLATHNTDSVELVVNQVIKNKLHHHRKLIHFSQLYGMSDNLTFALARAGYSTSKYLPYGEVEKAMPYLIRRAEENTAIAGQMSRELQLLKLEMVRRRIK